MRQRGMIDENRIIDDICDQRAVDPHVLREVVVLAVEIAREGREGRKIGTLFTVGDAEAVFASSWSMILDPLYGHPTEKKRLRDPDLRETVKELAQLDGAFVISADGVALSACRHLNASSEGIHLSMGLGARHMAAASISRHTRAVAVVVSETSVVRLFRDGVLVAEILPELWMLAEQTFHVTGPGTRRHRAEHLTAVSKND
jgi:DNA integrity scanning protein DisA with diadenylate cyclase activity